MKVEEQKQNAKKFFIEYFSDHFRIQSKNDAFNVITKRCSFENLSSIMEYKTLLLDKNNILIGAISFKQEDGITNEQINSLFTVVSGQKNVTKVIIGKNSLKKNVIPNDDDEILAQQFFDFGKKMDIPVIEQFIVATNNYSPMNSLETNNIQRLEI